MRILPVSNILTSALIRRHSLMSPAAVNGKINIRTEVPINPRNLDIVIKGKIKLVSDIQTPHKLRKL